MKAAWKSPGCPDVVTIIESKILVSGTDQLAKGLPMQVFHPHGVHL